MSRPEYVGIALQDKEIHRGGIELREISIPQGQQIFVSLCFQNTNNATAWYNRLRQCTGWAIWQYYNIHHELLGAPFVELATNYRRRVSLKTRPSTSDTRE